MTTFGSVGAILCFTLAAVNAALYVHGGQPVSLGAAVFCAGMAVVNLAIGRTR